MKEHASRQLFEWTLSVVRGCREGWLELNEHVAGSLCSRPKLWSIPNGDTFLIQMMAFPGLPLNNGTSFSVWERGLG